MANSNFLDGNEWRRCLRGTCFKRTLVVTAMTAAASALGANVDASLTGLVQGRPAFMAGEAQTIAPFIALVGLNASDFAVGPVQDVRIGVGAWGRVSLTGEQSAGDVDLAFISGKVLEKRLTVTLGRQFRSGGAFRALHLDGGSVDVRLPGRLGLTVFGGAPVVPRFATVAGDAAWGARAYWRFNWDTEIGASYFELWNRGYVARRDVGIDARTELFRRVRLSGSAVLSALEGRLAEGDVSPIVKVSDAVEVSAFFRHTSPDLLLPRTSILSVFAQTEQKQGGVGVLWFPSDRLSVGIDGRLISIPNDPFGYEVVGQGTLRPTKNTRATVEAVRLGLTDNGYTRVRLAGGATLGKLMFSLDLDGYWLDRAVNNTRHSLTASASARLQLPWGFDAVVSGLVATDPFYQQRFEVIGRLIYTFRIHTKVDTKKDEPKKDDEEASEKDAGAPKRAKVGASS